MSDLIRREDVLGACIKEAHKAHRYKLGQTWELNYYEIEKAINSIPTVEPKTGHWIFNPLDAIEMMFTKPKCSVCGFESSDGGNYCPNCGTKMERETNE